jgi:hypothetical protein
VDTILEIIDELVESIYECMKQEMYADDQRQRFIEQDLHRLKMENTRMENINVADTAVLEIITSRYQELKNKIAVQIMTLENKAIERADIVTLCQEERYSYDQLSD